MKCSLHSILLHEALQLSLDGLNVPLGAGCLLQYSVVVACKVIDLSVVGLEHVLEVSWVVGGWVM